MSLIVILLILALVALALGFVIKWLFIVGAILLAFVIVRAALARSERGRAA